MMLKFFFWTLLLANAGLFAYRQGYFDAMLSNGHEPARMSEQLNADRIKLIRAPEPKPEPAPAPVPEAPPPVAEAPAKKAEIVACVELGNFDPDEARRFTARLAPLSLGDRLSQRAIMEVANHMVYIPPQADKEDAEKKASELRRLGIEDFFIIQDNSPLRWGISLGVFRHEEAARTHLANLVQKGVRSARIRPRTVASGLVAFQVKALDAETKSVIDKIKAGFPKQEMRTCDAA